MGLRLFTVVSAVSAAVGSVWGEPSPGRLLTQYLQPDTTYRVGIAPHVPTTIIFPAPGLGFQGVGLMQASDLAPQPVQIEHVAGTHYFTVRAIMPEARSDLNVIFEGRLYAFVFALAKEPTRGLTLLRPPAPGRESRRAPRVAVTRLVELLDEARVYDVISGAFPGYQKNISVQEKGYRVPYPLFDVLVDQAWRFEEEDTIVLRCVFINKSPRTLHYRPDVVAVKVGERTFYCSIADATGEIPAVPDAAVLEAEERRLTQELEAARAGGKGKEVGEGKAKARLREILAAYQRGQAVGYFAITGNPDGTRANLSLKNNFNVLVATGKLP
jgi:hypothetical protein